VRFSPDGKTALTASRDRTVRLWNSATGKPLLPPLVHRNPLNAAVFSPDGRRILTATGEGKRLPSSYVGNGFSMLRGNDKRVFFRGNRRLLTGSEEERRLRASYHGEAVLWDVGTGKALESPQTPGGQNPYRPVRGGRPYRYPYALGLAGGALKAETTLRGLGTLDSQDPDQPVQAAAFSPDGKRFLLGLASGAIQVSDITHTFQNHVPVKEGGFVAAVAFSPDSRILLAGSSDFYDVATCKRIWSPVLHRGAASSACAFSPDGTTLVVRDNRGLFLYERAQGQLLWTADLREPTYPPPPLVAFSSDGQQILRLDGEAESGSDGQRIPARTETRTRSSFTMPGTESSSGFPWSRAGGRPSLPRSRTSGAERTRAGSRSTCGTGFPTRPASPSRPC
jgi:WD40 repeat protein